MNINATPPENTATHLAPVNALPVGTRMQEFEIQSVIGEGGFGIVYRAHDTLLGREVAIKEYLPVSHAARLADGTVVASSGRQRETFEKGLRHFVAEARMLARFKHPALVEILRFWKAQGTAYMVMPYYQGQSLHALIVEGFRLTDDASLHAFLAPLLDGLAQLHQADCFHRDISTDNILMLDTGQPLLLDFGAARSVLVSKSELSTVILKPGFAPIEQYSDAPDTMPQGAWTDIYALAAVTYQAITGIMPPVSVARIIRDPLVPLVQRAPVGLSPTVLTAIDAGLRVPPTERPQSLQALRELMTAEPVDAPHVPVPGITPPDQTKPLPQHQPPPPIPPRLRQPAPPAARMPSRGRRAWLIAAPLFLLLLGLYAVLRLGGSNPVQVTSGQSVTPSETQHPANEVTHHTGEQASTDHNRPTDALDPPAHGANHSADHRANITENESLREELTGVSTGNESDALSDRTEAGGSGSELQNTAPQPPPVPPTQATLAITVEPWGDIYINGQLMGTTPPTLRLHLQPGELTLEMRNDAYPARHIPLKLEAGNTYRIKHVFGD